MARPRVFISSTFYDLRQVREDLERSIRELGFEPVRNEAGAIAYGKDEHPEAAAYREVELCDVIISIVGGRFGTESRDVPGYSISQNELRRALERGIQVFVFVEKSVLSEYSTFELNKETPGVKYRFVDDTRIFKFIEELSRLPRNNPIAPFETAADIGTYLKEQFAGLFHRFLRDQKRVVEFEALDRMNSIAKTLQDVVSFLTEERKNRDDAIKAILHANHPAFRRFAEVTKTPYRVYFVTRAEMESWLRARSWSRSDECREFESVEEWENPKEEAYIQITEELFDGNGRFSLPSEGWKDEWVQRRPLPKKVDTLPPPEDDIPF